MPLIFWQILMKFLTSTGFHLLLFYSKLLKFFSSINVVVSCLINYSSYHAYSHADILAICFQCVLRISWYILQQKCLKSRKTVAFLEHCGTSFMIIITLIKFVQCIAQVCRLTIEALYNYNDPEHCTVLLTNRQTMLPIAGHSSLPVTKCVKDIGLWMICCPFYDRPAVFALHCIGVPLP